MSFSDPSFLFSNRLTDRERDAERAFWERQRQIARSCYQWATNLVLLTMIFVALPLGLEKWHWPAVIAAALVITILAVVMFFKGARQNACIALIFAGVILPGWIYLAPTVLRVAQEQWLSIAKEWQRVF